MAIVIVSIDCTVATRLTELLNKVTLFMILMYCRPRRDQHISLLLSIAIYVSSELTPEHHAHTYMLYKHYSIVLLFTFIIVQIHDCN